jgi:hypothetical protein
MGFLPSKYTWQPLSHLSPTAKVADDGVCVCGYYDFDLLFVFVSRRLFSSLANKGVCRSTFRPLDHGGNDEVCRCGIKVNALIPPMCCQAHVPSAPLPIPFPHFFQIKFGPTMFFPSLLIMLCRWWLDHCRVSSFFEKHQTTFQSIFYLNYLIVFQKIQAKGRNPLLENNKTTTNQTTSRYKNKRKQKENILSADHS